MRIRIKPLKYTCSSRNDFNRNFIPNNSIINVFALKWQLIDSQLSKTMAGKDPQMWRISMLQTQIVHSENYRLLFICYHPNLYKKNILRFRIIIYRFHVFQTSGDPSFSIFTLSEPHDASSPPYIEFKWNWHWWETKHLTIWRKKSHR